MVARLLQRRMRRAGLLVPDQVIGLAWTGAFDASRMRAAIRDLPQGLTEIYTHPATADAYPGSAPGYRYRDELAALLDADAKALLERKDIDHGHFGSPPDAILTSNRWRSRRPVSRHRRRRARGSGWARPTISGCLSRMMLDSHDAYRPALIHWPELAPETRDRIVSLPIWDIAVQTEGRASMNVKTFNEQVDDPLLHEAIGMNAYEERRHKIVLADMVQAYGIELQPEPAYVRPRDPEFAFMRTGYSECIDSFFGFGLFKLAKDTGFFPDELIDTFEPVMREEGRHILFFVNWVAWWRATMPWWRRPYFEAKVCWSGRS